MASSSIRYVDHTYRDFSDYVEQGGRLIKHKKSDKNFPAQVHKMLSNTCPSHCHLIAWMPHGRAFKILDREALVKVLLPHYLICKQYQSFTRQLTGWGFKRLHQSGPDSGGYYHECFLRGRPKLTCLIRRLPPNQGRSTPFPAGEPNFYRIAELFPLTPLRDPSHQLASASAERRGGGSEATVATSDALAPIAHDHTHQFQHPSLQSMQTTASDSSVTAAAAQAGSSNGNSQRTSARDSMEDSIGFAAPASIAPSRGPSNNEILNSLLGSGMTSTQGHRMDSAAMSSIMANSSNLVRPFAHDGHHSHPSGHNISLQAPHPTNHPADYESYLQYFQQGGNFSSQRQPQQYEDTPRQQPRQYQHYNQNLPPNNVAARLRESIANNLHPGHSIFSNTGQSRSHSSSSPNMPARQENDGSPIMLFNTEQGRLGR